MWPPGWGDVQGQGKVAIAGLGPGCAILASLESPAHQPFTGGSTRADARVAGKSDSGPNTPVRQTDRQWERGGDTETGESWRYRERHTER